MKQQLEQQIHPEIPQLPAIDSLPGNAATLLQNVGRVAYLPISRNLSLAGSDLPLVIDEVEVRASMIPRQHTMYTAVAFIPENVADFVQSPIGDSIRLYSQATNDVDDDPARYGVAFLNTGVIKYKLSTPSLSHTFYITQDPQKFITAGHNDDVPFLTNLPIILDRTIIDSIKLEVDGRAAIDQIESAILPNITLMADRNTITPIYSGVARDSNPNFEQLNAYRTRLPLTHGLPAVTNISSFVPRIRTIPNTRPQGMHTASRGASRLYDLFYRNDISEGDYIILHDVYLSMPTIPGINSTWAYDDPATILKGSMILWTRQDRRVAPEVLSNGSDGMHWDDPWGSDTALFWEPVDESVRYEVVAFKMHNIVDLHVTSIVAGSTFTIDTGLTTLEPWMDHAFSALDGAGNIIADLVSIDLTLNTVTFSTSITPQAGPVIQIRRRHPLHPEYDAYPYGFLNAFNVPDMFNTKLTGVGDATAPDGAWRVLRNTPDCVGVSNRTGGTNDNGVRGYSESSNIFDPLSSIKIVDKPNDDKPIAGRVSLSNGTQNAARVSGDTWVASALVGKAIYVPRTGFYSAITSNTTTTLTFANPYYKASSNEIYWIVDVTNELLLEPEVEYVVAVRAVIHSGTRVYDTTTFDGQFLYSAVAPYSHPHYVKLSTSGELTVQPFMFDLTPQSITNSYIGLNYTKAVDYTQAGRYRLNSNVFEGDIANTQDMVISTPLQG